MNNKVKAAQNLVNRIHSNNTTKPVWPRPVKVLASGSNGIIFVTENSKKLLKVAMGNSSREVKAMVHLLNGGSKFIPKVYTNYVAIRKVPTNDNIRSIIFPQTRVSVYPNGMTAFVMNKVGNMSLYSYAKSYSPSENNKRRIKSDILKAIKFMHAHGISHGDLHAANILVEIDSHNRFKRIWIIDLGRYVNIPKGMSENNVYKSIPVYSSNYENYSVFNNNKPRTTLYNTPSGLARRNYELYEKMYKGNYKPTGSVQKLKNVFRRSQWRLVPKSASPKK